MAYQLEHLRLQDLRAYDRNARTHSSEQVAQLVNSIKEFGFTNPVLVDEVNTLIAGHGRSEAARTLGLETVPAIRLVGLSDQQKKALRIADNQLALNAGWDMDLLATELADLQVDGFDLDILGFDDEFLDGLLVGVDDAGTGMPSLPSGEKPSFQNKTFLLHDEQAAIVDEALTLARASPLADTGLNENGNGNALALICKQWLEVQNEAKR